MGIPSPVTGGAYLFAHFDLSLSTCAFIGDMCIFRCTLWYPVWHAHFEMSCVFRVGLHISNFGLDPLSTGAYPIFAFLSIELFDPLSGRAYLIFSFSFTGLFDPLTGQEMLPLRLLRCL